MIRSGRVDSQPFRIQVEQRVLDDLQLRLHRARWPSSGKKTDWSLGVDSEVLRELVDYWKAGYDWRAHEAAINAFAPRKARVGDADIFYLHTRGAAPRAVPLLLLHGWPDSFYRFHKVVPMLAKPSCLGCELDDGFDLVVPSLPGFAFTEGGQGAGKQAISHIAQLLWQLLTQTLGYDRFMVAGGDGGSAIAQRLAIDHPESVIGVHLTDLGWHAAYADPASLSKRERKYLESSQKLARADGAYALVQMSQPRTLAAGLNDSPLGLAAWIVDRFHSWVDFDRELEDTVSRDELLTNIMLYWVTQTIGSSMYSYHREAQWPSLTPADRVERPVALALFPKDLGGIPPRSFAERTLNVQRWTELARGGHFTALEQPEAYARDLVDFSRQLRGLRPRFESEVRYDTRAL